jgi:hypothetical protein
LGKTLIQLPPEKWKTYTHREFKGQQNKIKKIICFLDWVALSGGQQEEGKEGRQQIKPNPQNKMNGSKPDFVKSRILSVF